MNRVVITGMGIYSTIGLNLEEVRDSLYHGKSGIVLDQERKEMGFRSGLTGRIEAPVLKGILPRKLRIGMAEPGEYAYMATVEALKNAKIDDDYLEKNEVGILYGNDSCAKPIIDAAKRLMEKKDTQLIGAGSIFQSMTSTITMNLSSIFKLRGANFTLSAACASGSHAIGMGYLMIKWGLQKAIICGGAQEINYHSMGSFDGLSAFSIRESSPTEASRPFDKDRDGLVPSGGGATIIIEDYESAIKRGAPILAELTGYGFSSNGAHISQPDVSGPTRSLEMSLKDAGIDASEVDYVNAHATSTPVGDLNEAKALAGVFAGSSPYISSTKGMTGHEMWMAGASEVVYSLLMMENSFVAPNINFNSPDEASAQLNIAAETVETKVDMFLSNSFGFGGTNSSLIVKKLSLQKK